ncbi:acid shock protein [Pragia fontium]|uniref:Acid shock protein n=1 Tax=Pragia fontium TaxID=82985 RepID=A0ABQ5LF45_9GAMM|nr:hypothetical protein [Pragia fontium]AKJ41686.1 hypothetical protein QQ39_05980 [Pragia fontium]GKX62229.1 acid shock protein [Pragia fontium]
MKKLLPLAVAAMFVLSGSAFAASTATQPVKDVQHASVTKHKSAHKAKQHKKQLKAKTASQQPAGTPTA